jgi:hypothetical protein
MTRSSFGPRRIRTLMRTFHLTLSVAAGVLLYAQHAVSDSTARAGIAYVIFPLLFVSGGAMWQQARLRKLFRGSKNKSARATVAPEGASVG